MSRPKVFLQAVVTRYCGPTNFRGSRIIASSQAGRITVSYDHNLSAEENHIVAAMALIQKWGWQDHGKWVGGVLPDNRGHCFVCDTEAK